MLIIGKSKSWFDYTDSLYMTTNSSLLKDRDKLTEAINASRSSKEVLEYLGIRAAGGNYDTLRKYALLYELTLPKWDYAAASRIANSRAAKLIPDEDIFVVNGTFDRRILKRRLLAIGRKEQCEECGLKKQWQGKAISLQLDHINGIPNDNRLENLRFLCPNCHSQTETFAGRKTVREKRDTLEQSKFRSAINSGHGCIDCNTTIVLTSKRCSPCDTTARQTRYGINYPDIEILIEQLTATNFVKVAKELGVSDNALRKHVRKFVDPSHPLLNKKRKLETL